MEEVIYIVLISVASVAFGRYLKHRQRMQEIAAKREASPDIQKEIAELRDRVKTLETIVTDKGYQLHEEIEKLNG
ncbi:hypothetical protein [Aurantivibrio plasticivorans]